MGEDHDGDSMTEIYAQNDRICTAELEILMEPAAGITAVRERLLA
jgi:hypothetical protein